MDPIITSILCFIGGALIAWLISKVLFSAERNKAEKQYTICQINLENEIKNFYDYKRLAKESLDAAHQESVDRIKEQQKFVEKFCLKK